MLMGDIEPSAETTSSPLRRVCWLEQDERAARLAVIEERLAEIGERAEQVIIEDQKKNAVFWQGVRGQAPVRT
jgi:hypothetical protein